MTDQVSMADVAAAFAAQVKRADTAEVYLRDCRIEAAALRAALVQLEGDKAQYRARSLILVSRVQEERAWGGIYRDTAIGQKKKLAAAEARVAALTALLADAHALLRENMHYYSAHPLYVKIVYALALAPAGAASGAHGEDGEEQK